MEISVANPKLTDAERTTIGSDYASGTSVTVRNNDGFTANWFAIAGEPGQERTESDSIASTTGNTTLTLDNGWNFSHPKSTPVYLSQWDKISFERKPSGGAWAVNQTPSVEWDNHNNETVVKVSGGATTDTYRWRFYNSQTGTYSSYSDELPGTGLTRDTLGYVIQQVKRNRVAKKLDDQILIDYADDYQSFVQEQIPKAWWFQKEGSSVSTVADDYTYSISDNWSDFESMKFMLYNYVNGSTDYTYPLTYSPLNEFYNYKSDANQNSDDNARYWTILPPDSSSALGYIGLHPTPDTTSCALKPVYQFKLTKLDSFADTLVVPFAKGYIDYILYRIYDDIKDDSSNATKYNQRVASGILALKTRARRQRGQPELFRYRGQRGWSRQYGDNPLGDWQTRKENYW